MLEQILQELAQSTQARIDAAGTPDALETVRVEVLGRKGTLAGVSKDMGKLTAEQKASILDSLAFALTHLAHFGIVFVAGHWSFLFLPAAIWVMLMFLASRLFFICKVKSGSILGAILCHAGFNLAMTYYIIYFIL